MYSVRTFMEIAEKLKNRKPDFNLTTDIIVGFPGETETDFQETCKVSKDIGFSHIHTFKYSVRKGTRAERMQDHIPKKVKTERSEILRKVVEETKLKYRQSFIGKNQNILIETFDKQGFAKGYGEHYLPVLIKEQNLEHNNFYPVKISGIEILDEPVLIGEIIKITNSLSK